jgi:hypothetical protein
MLARLSKVRTLTVRRWVALNGLSSDALLYFTSGLFALLLGSTSGQAPQWHWGYLAAGPYVALGVVALVLSRLNLRRAALARIALLSLVVLGAVAIPLGLEARWRQAQPEVAVIQRSAALVTKGQDPYRAYLKNGRVVDEVPGRPAYESFFPYFPLMSVFGLPSALTHKGTELSDARIVMSLMTLITGVFALWLLRASRRQKIRIAQVLLALPTGALFLATGGDDMPILALMLLGVAAMQRRSNYVVGVSLGLAAAMKLTAWPMAAAAVLVARERSGASAWRKVASLIAVIVVVTITPFVLHAPWAFFSNVFAFPLGLAGVSSPAASALPGHILTMWWAPLGHVLAPVTFVIGGYFVARYAERHWPLSLSQLLGLMSIVFVVLMCVASATRIGYVIYPINFALWSMVCREPKPLALEPVQMVSEF